MLGGGAGGYMRRWLHAQVVTCAGGYMRRWLHAQVVACAGVYIRRVPIGCARAGIRGGRSGGPLLVGLI
jgi:hypothetical protein